MQPTFKQFVRSSSVNLSLREILQQPVTELQGVGTEAATALERIHVRTIFDLGSSAIFGQGSAACSAADSSLKMIASDIIDSEAADVALSDIPGSPLNVLRGLSTADATALADALHTPTVRDFALWPPRQMAHEIVSFAAGTVLTVDDTAEELRPKMGQYPTERVYYDKLVMLGAGSPGNQTPLREPLSLTQLTGSGSAFGAPAVGAIATYSQSWFAQGITLGHMVHSLALAPGEATRIAVIDWARRTQASATESVDEREQLDNATSHSRAASEIQNAVANEMQSGGSFASGWAKSTSDASGWAASAGGGVAGVYQGITGVFGFGGGGSSSSQESETKSEALSTSWSVGSRSVMAEMTQTVNDRTEQHATSVRNRRASAVREVSQSEHEQVSTRIVANYNHMHALTVQYYEVVQLYRVTVQLNKFERVLFVPFELLDFSGADAADLVARFRFQLRAAALSERVAQLLFDERGRIEIRSGVRISQPFSVGDLATEVMTSRRFMARMADNVNSAAGSPSSAIAPPSAGDPATPATPLPKRFTVVRPGPVAEIVPGDAVLVSLGFEDVGIDRVRIDQEGVSAEATTFVVPGATDQIDFATPIPLRTISSIHVARDTSTESVGSMILRYESEGHRQLAVVPLSLISGTNMQVAAFLAGDSADRRAELHAHLHANRVYYTRAVLANLDSASLVSLLSSVTWLGRPLVDQVEPNPVAVSGNFLVLRAPAETSDASGLVVEQTWGQLLEERGIDFDKADERLIPVPTGGVFAEAVLGRSNSAEKLDVTRFWNWQDSPIPLQPTEIAVIGTGSRGSSDDLRPGQLSAPVLNIMNPTALPDPTGLTASLGALATANMFRDMSGLAGTQATIQAASSGTLSAATEAGRIASANFQAATNQATEMGKAAADMWKVLNANNGGGGSGGSGSAGGGSKAGISGDGAWVNHGRDLDQRGVSGGSRAGGASSSGVSTSGGGASGTDAFPTSGDGRTISGDYMPGVPPFARELAYSDEGRAASPNLVGAVANSLGVPVTPANAGGSSELLTDPTKPQRLLGPWLYLWDFPNNRLGQWPPAWFTRARQKEAQVTPSPGAADPFWPIQRIEEARGHDINMDSYRAKIITFPTEAGTVMDHRALFEYIRRHIDDLADAETWNGLRLANFEPVDAEEKAIWESQDPRGAMIHIDAFGPDDFDLMVTAYHVDDDRAGWVFSTIMTDNAGRHPLSGCRAFGIRRTPVGWEVYTEAVDRWERAVYTIGDFYGADVQHRLWQSFIASCAEFIESRGGKAEIEPPVRHSVQWALLEPYFSRGQLQIVFP